MTQFIVHALPAGEIDDGAPTAVRVVNEDRSPYTSEGPVFVHAGGCEPHAAAPGALPEQVDGRSFSLRAYDDDAMMLDAEIVPGDRLGERARALLDGGAAFLHAHFAGPGCYACRIDRAA